jgi:hypothetical protein
MFSWRDMEYINKLNGMDPKRNYIRDIGFVWARNLND